MQRKSCSIVTRIDAGRSLLDWLSSRFTYLDKQSWRAMIVEGRILVDGLPVATEHILSAGELVDFRPPEEPEPEVDPSFTVLWEDADFLVVDKSGNLPCHPGGRYFEHTLSSLLREKYGEIRIATRLDRETSGLVLACKSSASAAFAARMLASGRVRKTYLALTHGLFPDHLEAIGFLVDDTESLLRKKRRFHLGSCPPPRGRRPESCRSVFEALATTTGPSGAFSLVKAIPATGRTHQLRASLLALGFPIVGDKLYGLDETIFLRLVKQALTKEDLTRLMLPNQALHCAALSFENGAGKTVSVESSPRWDFPYGELLAASRR